MVVGVPESEWDSASALVDPERVRPRVYLQPVPEAKGAKNLLLLDLRSATVHRPRPRRAWRRRPRPGGNEFCVT